jgi:hypothetical protein
MMLRGFIAALLIAGCTSSRSGSSSTQGGSSGASAGESSRAGSTTATGGSASGAGASSSGGTPGSAGTSAGAAGAADGQRIVVSAGALAREHSIVRFPLQNLDDLACALQDEQGQILPLQVSNGEAVFVLPALEAGQERAYELRTFDALPAAAVTSTQGESDVQLAIGAAPLVRFQAQGELPAGVDAIYLRGGYLHPLYSPSGVVVTADYPASHIHHHGIWSAWTRAQFNGHAIDFWNMADGLGTVDFEALDRLWQGPVHAGFEAKLAHIDLVGAEPVTALTEQWIVTGYKTHDAPAPYLVFDLESVQRTATAMPVALEQYIYGGFGIRGPDEWLDKAKVTFLTSEGADRGNGDATTGHWLYIGGSVGGKVAGYALLGHPENFRAPQPFRIHPDEPYASLSPVKAGAFSIEPGADYRTRFRIITLDGTPDANLLDALWDDYATPATVRVE